MNYRENATPIRLGFVPAANLPIRTWGEYLTELVLWIVVPLGLVLLFWSCAIGCNHIAVQTQARTADGIAVAANAAMPLMVEHYRSEGVKVIEQAKTEEEARKGLDAVKAKWADFWKAWDVLQKAHEAWAKSLEAGENDAVPLGVLKTAYCELLKNWPGDVPAIPLAPVLCGGEP